MASASTSMGLGLFIDPRLSLDTKISCQSCHQPAKAFQDGLPKAIGAQGRIGARNTPSLLNVAMERTLFWDGRRETLEAQALDPILNHLEHGMGSAAAVVERLKSIPEYAVLFQPMADKRVPDNTEVLVRMSQALAAFQRTLADGPSPFDRFRYEGKTTELTESARRGWRLFEGRAACISCHSVGDAAPALFTDHGFHALPQGMNKINDRLSELVTKFAAARGAGRRLDEILLSDAQLSELGRFAVTEDPADIGKFKTPSLRNAALTAPYMHDGSVATLEDAVDVEVYSRASENGRPLILTPNERADLVAFLKSLTGFTPSMADSLVRSGVR